MSFDLTDDQRELRRQRAQEQIQAFNDGWPRPSMHEGDFLDRLIADRGHAVCQETEITPGRFGVALCRPDRVVAVVSYAVSMKVAA